MKVLIIEDEKPAAEKLVRLLARLAPAIQVLGVLGSVEKARQWFREHTGPDLIFMDIELSDGLSFEIFNPGQPACPVIFTTAFDEYWQEAFEHNSIDYLLKPIRAEKLLFALHKYENLKNHFTSNVQELLHWKRQATDRGYKRRFLVKRGTDYVSVRADEIAYLYATHKLVCLVDEKGQKFILDHSLSEIEKQLDPSSFYRINRKYLVHLKAIRRIRSHTKSKLLLDLEPAAPEEVLIPQENVMAFKAWMDR